MNDWFTFSGASHSWSNSHQAFHCLFISTSLGAFFSALSAQLKFAFLCYRSWKNWCPTWSGTRATQEIVVPCCRYSELRTGGQVRPRSGFSVCFLLLLLFFFFFFCFCFCFCFFFFNSCDTSGTERLKKARSFLQTVRCFISNQSSENHDRKSVQTEMCDHTSCNCFCGPQHMLDSSNLEILSRGGNSLVRHLDRMHANHVHLVRKKAYFFFS